jgi:hypothetical protein
MMRKSGVAKSGDSATTWQIWPYGIDGENYIQITAAYLMTHITIKGTATRKSWRGKAMLLL